MDTDSNQAPKVDEKRETNLSGGTPDLGAPTMRQNHCLKADDCTINLKLTTEDTK
jgi:hypothetical protein